MNIVDLLRDPSLENMDVDSYDRINRHRLVLSRKPLLQAVFVEFHHLFRKLQKTWLGGEGRQIELGAGVAPMHDTYPEVLATDVVAGAGIDFELDAQAMALDDESVLVFYAQNCFHHFSDPERFFTEMERVLVPGGGAILLEPYYGWLASFLYRRLFHTEGFDKSSPSWKVDAHGPMNGANQALSYIVFVRDQGVFESRFPGLEIVARQRVPNYLKYLLSGGLNFRALVPHFFSPLVDAVQFCLRPFDRWLSLHHIVVLRKKIR